MASSWAASSRPTPRRSGNRRCGLRLEKFCQTSDDWILECRHTDRVTPGAWCMTSDTKESSSISRVSKTISDRDAARAAEVTWAGRWLKDRRSNRSRTVREPPYLVSRGRAWASRRFGPGPRISKNRFSAGHRDGRTRYVARKRRANRPNLQRPTASSALVCRSSQPHPPAWWKV
jgi:hypothetical protein